MKRTVLGADTASEQCPELVAFVVGVLVVHEISHELKVAVCRKTVSVQGKVIGAVHVPKDGVNMMLTAIGKGDADKTVEIRAVVLIQNVTVQNGNSRIRKKRTERFFINSFEIHSFTLLICYFWLGGEIYGISSSVVLIELLFGGSALAFQIVVG